MQHMHAALRKLCGAGAEAEQDADSADGHSQLLFAFGLDTRLHVLGAGQLSCFMYLHSQQELLVCWACMSP